MSININNKEVKRVYFGNTEVSKIYKGSDLVYRNRPIYYCYRHSNIYYYFTELVTEIKAYDLYCKAGREKANSASEVSLQGTLTPNSIISQDNFKKVNDNYVHIPENDLYN